MLSVAALADETETTPPPKFDPVAAYEAKYGKKPKTQFDWSSVKKPSGGETSPVGEKVPTGEKIPATTGEGDTAAAAFGTKPYTKEQWAEWIAAQDAVTAAKEKYLLQQQAAAAVGPVDTTTYMEKWSLKEYGTGPTGIGGTAHGGGVTADVGTSAYPVDKPAVAALLADPSALTATTASTTKPVSTVEGTTPSTPTPAAETAVSTVAPATSAPATGQQAAAVQAPAPSGGGAPTPAEVLGEGAEMVYRPGGGSGSGGVSVSGGVSPSGSGLAAANDADGNSAFPGGGGSGDKAFWDYSKNTVAYERRVKPMELEAPDVPTPGRLPDAAVPAAPRETAVAGAPAAEAPQPGVPPQVERALQNALQVAQDPASSPQQVAAALNVLVQINNIFEVPGSTPSAELREAAALVNQILGGDAPKGTDVLVAPTPAAEAGGMGRLIAARTGVPMDEFDIFLKGQKGAAPGAKGEGAVASGASAPAVGRIGPLLEGGKLKDLKVPAAGGKLTAEATNFTGVPKYRVAGRRVVGVSPELIRRLSAALRERAEGVTVAQAGGRVIRGRRNVPGLAALVDTGSSFWGTMWGMPVLVRLMLVLFALGIVYGRLRAMQEKQIKEMSDPSAVLEKALGDSPLLTAEAPALSDRKAKRA